MKPAAGGLARDYPRFRAPALVTEGKLKLADARMQLRDSDGGKAVAIHASSINWNVFRKKWILIGQQIYGGPSFGGEIWYAEADDVSGPWTSPRKIVTHDRYT